MSPCSKYTCLIPAFFMVILLFACSNNSDNPTGTTPPPDQNNNTGEQSNNTSNTGGEQSDPNIEQTPVVCNGMNSAALSFDNSTVELPAQEPIMYDNFEYDVSRDPVEGINSTNNNFIGEGPWTWSKSIQFGQPGAKGYLYTTQEIPCYDSPFPGHNSQSVLVIESLPLSAFDPNRAGDVPQTDVKLVYGSADPSAPEVVPANVWFQFWMYPNHVEGQRSFFHNRNKFIYPCNGFYPCQNNKWLLSMGRNSREPYWLDLTTDTLDFPIPPGLPTEEYPLPPESEYPSPGQLYINQRSAMGTENASGYMGVNLDTDAGIIQPNQWTLVKIHFDTSGEHWSFEMWLKPLGGQWTKVTEWISGVTPGFQWPAPTDEVTQNELRELLASYGHTPEEVEIELSQIIEQRTPGGHKVFAMPTTLGDAGGINRYHVYDSWIYMDDFVMSDSEETLPVYPY